MKITAIETIHNKNFSNLVWVKIHTDEGLTGLGETLEIQTPLLFIFMKVVLLIC